jgi:hypothetical protein
MRFLREVPLRAIMCLVTALTLVGTASACARDGGTMAATHSEGQGDMSGNTARPGWVAIKEEFDTAMAADTIPALELFLARHPDSPWSQEARARLARLKGG